MRDPMDIEGFDAEITCGECGTKFSAEVPTGMTPREIVKSGRKSLMKTLSWECPNCGARGEFLIQVGEGPGLIGQG